MTRLTRNLPILALTVALFAVVAIAGNALISIDSEPIGTPLKPDYASLSFQLEPSDDAATTTTEPEPTTSTTEPEPEAPTTTVYEPPVTVATTIYIPDSAARVPVVSGDMFDQLAQCESGGNPSTNTGNGYYGAFQFSATTWWGIGEEGYAHQFSYGHQKAAAVRLQARSGWGQWPACARMLGLL